MKKHMFELLDQRFEMMDRTRRLFFPDCTWKELTKSQLKVINDICNDILDAVDWRSDHDH